MAKTQKELAFLRDLYIQDDWTKRFTDLVDKHIDLSDSENMLYINAGTGGHALAIGERFGEKTDIFASCENEDVLTIARDKGAAIGSSVDFSTIRFEDDAFDAVLADASFVRPSNYANFIDNTVRVARTGGDIAVFLPSAGSFGEIFSILWEALFTEEMTDHGPAVEALIAELPPVWKVEEMAENAGLVNINTEVSNEVFDYGSSSEFISSPLVSDFLLPVWLETLDDNEKERVIGSLTQLIDSEENSISFRFSVKATLLTGEKA